MTIRVEILKLLRVGDRMEIYTDEHRQTPLTVQSARKLGEALIAAACGAEATVGIVEIEMYDD